MVCGTFSQGDSAIHRLDPRGRVVVAAALSIVVAVSDRPAALGAGLAAGLGLALVARLPPGRPLKRLAAVNAFMALLWLILPLTFQGPVAFSIGPLCVYHPGIIMSAQITLKSNAILIALMSLIATMPFSQLSTALNQLYVPDKIVHLLLMMYRYVFVIEQEYHRLIRATQIRGFRPGTNLHTYETYAYIVGMLFVHIVYFFFTPSPGYKD